MDKTELSCSDNDCLMLSKWIEEQWKTFWVYFDRVLAGKKEEKIKTITNTETGCNVYKDEGRRMACISHERAHPLTQYIVMTKYIFNTVEFIKQQSQFELIATEAGIQKAEQLFKINCLSCKP